MAVMAWKFSELDGGVDSCVSGVPAGTEAGAETVMDSDKTAANAAAVDARTIRLRNGLFT
jgi:hypothetical protein